MANRGRPGGAGINWHHFGGTKETNADTIQDAPDLPSRQVRTTAVGREYASRPDE